MRWAEKLIIQSKNPDEKKQRSDRCGLAKIATNHCYKSLFFNLRNSLIYKGFL